MKNFIKSIRITIAFCILFSVCYVLILWAFGQFFGPGEGNAETITLNGKVVGAANVGQAFTKDIYFWGRPSAADYKADSSAGSNKGPTNEAYLAEVEARVDSFLVHHPYLERKDVPVEMVTASGSGLDPHITPACAYVQVKRVAEGDGLGALQVGVTGHDGGGVLGGLPADDLDQLHDVSLQSVAVVPQSQTDVQRHLVVPAAAGVEALAGVADAGGEGLLHEGMDVLGVGVDGEGAGGQVICDGGKTAQNIFAVLLGDDALLCQHGGVNAAAAHILRDHPLVEADGRVEVVDAGIDRLGETALPKLFCHCNIPFI